MLIFSATICFQVLTLAPVQRNLCFDLQLALFSLLSYFFDVVAPWDDPGSAPELLPSISPAANLAFQGIDAVLLT